MTVSTGSSAHDADLLVEQCAELWATTNPPPPGWGRLQVTIVPDGMSRYVDPVLAISGGCRTVCKTKVMVPWLVNHVNAPPPDEPPDDGSPSRVASRLVSQSGSISGTEDSSSSV